MPQLVPFYSILPGLDDIIPEAVLPGIYVSPGLYGLSEAIIYWMLLHIGWLTLSSLYEMSKVRDKPVNLAFIGGRTDFATYRDRHGRLIGVSRQYLIYDANDFSGASLKQLYGNMREITFVEGGVFNPLTNRWETCVMFFMSHHRMLHDNTYHSHFSHTPFVWFDGTNGHILASLPVIHPNAYVLFLYRLYGIRVLSNNQELVVIPGRPRMILVYTNVENLLPR